MKRDPFKLTPEQREQARRNAAADAAYSDGEKTTGFERQSRAKSKKIVRPRSAKR